MDRRHDKIIATAAKSKLGPIGFKRKGRSRIWIADHNWWAAIVEFQPSAWSKGSYLNVSVHWLWSSENHISFDYGGRMEGHVEYRSDEQFSSEAARLALLAANEASKLSHQFRSLPETAMVLVAEARSTDSKAWPAFNAGVAAGISELKEEANEMFTRVATGFALPDSRLARLTHQMAALLEEPRLFRDKVASLIDLHRAALQLPSYQIEWSDYR